MSEPNRSRLIAQLLLMPDEAFSWLVLACQKHQPGMPGGQVWPDGTGGFAKDSQQSIAAVQAEAEAYFLDATKG